MTSSDGKLEFPALDRAKELLDDPDLQLFCKELRLAGYSPQILGSIMSDGGALLLKVDAGSTRALLRVTPGASLCLDVYFRTLPPESIRLASLEKAIEVISEMVRHDSAGA